MRAAIVAARDKGRLFLGDPAQGGGRIAHSLDAGGIAPGADDEKIVVHDFAPADPETVGDEFVLGLLVMDEDDVGVAARRGLERLPGALRDDVDLNAGVLLKYRQQIGE